MEVADETSEFAITMRRKSAVPRVVEVRVGGVSAPSLTDGFIYLTKPVSAVMFSGKTGTLRAKASGRIDAGNKFYVCTMRVSTNSKQRRLIDRRT